MTRSHGERFNTLLCIYVTNLIHSIGAKVALPCGLCVHRCPVGAISLEGHDKEKCQVYVYGKLRQTAGQLYGVMETG